MTTTTKKEFQGYTVLINSNGKWEQIEDNEHWEKRKDAEDWADELVASHGYETRIAEFWHLIKSVK